MQGTRFQITTKTDAQRNDVVSRVDKTLMNQVEARSSCGISPDVRGMWGHRPGCSCQRCQTCFAVAHLHQSLRRNFCRCAPELCQTHCRESPQSAGKIRSTPQVSWLVSGINTPEGSCVVEEFCCNEFTATLLTSGGCLSWLSTVCYM